MEDFMQLTTELSQRLLPLLHLQLVNSDLAVMNLGRLLAALSFFLISIKISSILVRFLGRHLYARRIKDEDTLLWFKKFNRFILIIAALVAALLIAGVKHNAISVIWNLTLFTIGDSRVDLGNIIIGIALLYPGIKLSSYLSGEFHSIILDRLKMTESGKILIGKIFQYFLVILIGLFVMTIIGIPLTAFTVIGGALAIGFGLGSQNLVNNFLSGIILLVERPVSVGDIVDVENHKGIVEEIGARATRIKTFDHLRVIIPNSKFLENTFINWSLVDSYLRREIIVGVAYGTDMDKALDISREIVVNDQDVEKYPEPLILFEEFGDNALNIRILFWINFSTLHSPLLIGSRIRSNIYKAFRKEKITIAFPQRDVHLDAVRTIPVEIVNKNDKTDV